MGGKHKELVHISQDELTNLEKDTPKCKYCNKSIWYDSTKVSFRNDGRLGFETGGTTYRTTKTLNGRVYPILVCQHCLEKKYPDFKEKNKSKIFNTFNKYVVYAFEIPQDIIDEKNKLSVPTLENCIRKYGEEKGREVFEEYKRKQAYTNSFEYKKEKYGWTKEQYDEYNKSRSVTLENLIKRHGEEEGTEIWKHYCERQSETSSTEYIRDKFGEYECETINLLKSGKLEGFIRKYGETEGKKRFNNFIDAVNNSFEDTNKYHQSKRGVCFFNKIVKRLSELGYNFTYYYGDNEMRKYSHIDSVLYSLDFFILELNICIEFNGDYWHANPEIYDKKWIHPIKKVSAEEIWKYDANRNKTLKEEFSIDVINVWEKSIYIDKKEDIIIDEIVKKIEYVSKNKENRKNQ